MFVVVWLWSVFPVSLRVIHWQCSDEIIRLSLPASWWSSPEAYRLFMFEHSSPAIGLIKKKQGNIWEIRNVSINRSIYIVDRGSEQRISIVAIFQFVAYFYSLSMYIHFHKTIPWCVYCWTYFWHVAHLHHQHISGYYIGLSPSGDHSIIQWRYATMYGMVKYLLFMPISKSNEK